MATPHDPFARFGEVFERAVAAGIEDPNAMVVSSVGAGGRPSSRVVLLKSFDERGFVFYTNFESRKGREILANPHVALIFFWRELDEQVRIEGAAERVADEEADAYFASRPRMSQIGAWASRQSEPLDSRARLLGRAAQAEARFLGRAVERPPFWGGYRIVPDRIEFWWNQLHRLHDRVLYTREGDGWKVERLYP
jgi:pyridoxamine 5'-phosphate oxidase